MKIRGNFIAMLLGEKSELRERKSDGQLYNFNTVAIMQDSDVGSIRVHEDVFKDLKNMEHFKVYEMQYEFNTEYNNYIVIGIKETR